MKRFPRFFDKQVSNLLREQLVRLGYAFAAMQKFEPGVDGKGFDEALCIGDVLVKTPGIYTVTLSRMSQRIDGS